MDGISTNAFVTLHLPYVIAYIIVVKFKFGMSEIKYKYAT